MFLVPRYTLATYAGIMSRSYIDQDRSSWVDFSNFITGLTDTCVEQYAPLDARTLGKGVYDVDIIEKKLLCPTLWMSDYFFRNVGNGTHHGIDIILPAETPILSFDVGTVTKIKKWDGKTKNEGNCITIKGKDFFRSYMHCDTICVNIGQSVSTGQQIGTVGKTGNATQYHIHLQCDTLDSPFQPYRGDIDLTKIKKYTKNPLDIFGMTNVGVLPNHVNNTSGEIFTDMPRDPVYANAITFLAQAGIIKGDNGRIRPLDFLQRYEFALLIARVIQRQKLTTGLQEVGTNVVAYTDVTGYGSETIQALGLLQKYGIMMGSKNYFSPSKSIKGHEVLAVLGRLFFGLKDAKAGFWYTPYIAFFQSNGIIPMNWSFVGDPVQRGEVLRVLAAVLVQKG